MEFKKQQLKIENMMEQERCVSCLERGSAGATLKAGNLQAFTCYLLNASQYFHSSIALFSIF